MNKTTWIYLLLSTVLLSSCIEDFLNLRENLEEELVFEISTDVLANIASLQIIDASTNQLINDVEAQIVSSDFSEVYTITGSKELRARDGLLLLGVRKAEVLGAEGVKKLELAFNIENYYPTRSVLLADSLLQNHVVYLVPLSSEDAVIAESGKIQLTQAEKINFGTMGSISFDPNTRYTDSQGKAANSNIDVSINYYPGHDENKRWFESLLKEVSYLDYTGQEEEILLNPMGIMDINLQSGNQDITQLSYPAIIDMPVLPGTPNPLTNESVKVGDFIPAFYWNEDLSLWEADGFAIVKEESGQLLATLNVTHFTRWLIGFANRSSLGDGMDEECHVFLQLIGETPDTIRGTYELNGQQIVYEYTRKPEYRIYQIFPGCMSNQGFSPGKIIGDGKLTAQDYFSNANPDAFSELKFEDNISIQIQNSINLCTEVTKDYLFANLMARNAGKGILNYTYGSFKGSQALNLEDGENNFKLPIPDGSLNNWLFGDAFFEFVFEEDCQIKRSIKYLPLCDVPFGIDLGVNNGVPSTPSMVDLAISATCPDTDGNYLVRPSLPILFRDACEEDSPFSLLGMVEDGVIKKELPLTIGKEYDFKIQLGNAVVLYEEVEIPSSLVTYQYEENTLTLEFIEGTLFFRLEDFVLPQSICDWIG